MGGPAARRGDYQRFQWIGPEASLLIAYTHVNAPEKIMWIKSSVNVLFM